ncbi:MAG: hypothetical protein EPN40_09100 [Rhodanobacteraceae bacterium]|nr:MAG: hypothetical protein EPN40_09100 [Rhodanobacteraceae bacterium]
MQPDAAGSGGYYTSDDAYAGQGYYGYYGTGPYAGAFGWYGGYYGYGSPFFFNLGTSNFWGFPGYWDPWYSLDFPVWVCRDGCRYHHRHGHWQHSGWNGHDPHGSVIAHLSPPPGIRPEHALVTPGRHNGSARPIGDLANRRPLDSASFAPHDFARTPVRLPAVSPRAMEMPAGPAYLPSNREAPSAGIRPIESAHAPMAMPRVFSAPPPTAMAAPAPPSPTRARDSKIP